MSRNVYIIIITVLIVFIMGLLIPKNETLQKITTITPEVKSISDYVTASGRIKEGDRRDVYFENPAKIDKVFVSVGDFVSFGEVIAQVTPVHDTNFSLPDYKLDTAGITSVFKEYGFDVELDSGTVEKIDVKAENFKVKSPISGIVTSVNIKENDTVTQFHKLMSISDFSNLYVDAMIPENYSAKIKSGANAEIRSDAFENTVLTGKVNKIAPVAGKAASLTGDGETFVETSITLDKPYKYLRPGYSVNAKVVVNTIDNALTIPYECILQDDTNREYVYIIEKGRVKKKFVLTGYELEDSVQIKSGLNKESHVVLNPGSDISDNISVSETLYESD